jgi:hypothetical protein
MKTKLSFIFVFFACGSWIQAQDTVNSLIISEARFDSSDNAYIELTNMGDSTLHLNNFEFGSVHPGDPRIDTTDLDKWFYIAAGCWFMLPDSTLEPGESIVFAGDNITGFTNTGNVSQDQDCWYIRYHTAYWSDDPVPVLMKDSIVTDQVGGIFDSPGGQQVAGAKDVAGVSGATGNSILVRKFSIKNGTIDFEKGRGNNESESEWIVIPLQVHDTAVSRNQFWTLGNHVNAHLGPETLLSNTIAVNWSDSTLVIPWGIRRDDPVMKEFTRKPGIAWHYDYSANYIDSAFLSVRTGDLLTLYACGDEAEVIPFRIMVTDPTPDANIVIPKRLADTVHSFEGQGPLYEVTENVPGMDTIRGNALTANSYATRIDTLFKYIEKPYNAEFEIVFVDGWDRIHLKNGDKLRVTSESGQVKEYFIKVTGQFVEYYAFVTSDIYTIDQDYYLISFDFLNYDSVTVSDLLVNLIPSPGASIKVLDANGLEKTGLVMSGDIVKVTSADGFTEHTYNIEIQVPILNTKLYITSVRIYPNPSSGILNVSGIPAQCRIAVKDVMGRNIVETIAKTPDLQISLKNHPAGIYFILISNENGSACYKVILK